MRILYLNPLGELGGAERALLDLIAGLRSARPEWNLHLISSGDGPFVVRARSLGVECRVVEFPAAVARIGDSESSATSGLARFARMGRLCGAGLFGAGYVARLRAEIRRIAPDLIHTNGFKMHVAAAFARPAGVPVMWHVRDYVGGRPVMAKVLPMLSGRIAVAVANSQSVADDLRTLCPRLKVVAVHDAIDLNEFSPQGSKLDLDRLAGLGKPPDGAVRVGMLATMAHWKGHEVFLEALSNLPDASVRGFVIGGPLYQTEGSQHSLGDLRAFAQKLGISARVGFTGFVDNPAAAMRALDIVVHASTRPEPFGLTIAEAMASGRPVISTGCGGAAELVRDGVDSLVVMPRDAEGLAKAITRLASDALLRRRLAISARAAAEERFTRERLATQIKGVYDDIPAQAA